MSASIKRLSAILSLALAVALPLLAAQQAALADDGALVGGDPAVLGTQQIVHSGTFGGCDWSIDDGWHLVISPSASPESGYEAGQLPSNNLSSPSFWPWLRHVGSIASAEIQGGVSLEGSAARMFYGCYAMTSADLSGLDTSAVADMDGMFYGCSSLASLDLSGWDTGSVGDMGEMFYGCSSLTSLDLSGWNTEKVERMDCMFDGCSQLASLDLSGWDTGNVADMYGMFWGCSKLASIGDLSSWETGSVMEMGEMFRGCSKLASLDGISGWSTAKVENMGQMFRGCSSLTSLDLSGWNTEKVEHMDGMFYGCSQLASVDAISGWDTGSVGDMGEMFSGCSSLASLDLSGWNTEEVSNMGQMFRGCSSLTSLDLSGWNTEKVEYMDGMFSGCSQLASLDLSGWDTGNVADMDGMFRGCSSLTSLDLSGWDTGNVADMGGMFSGCTSVEALAIGASTVLAVLPPSSVNGRSDWYSTTDDRWFDENYILANRVGTADTYTKGIGIAGVEVSGIADKVYDGKAQTQSPTVKLGAEALAEGTDYALSYRGNVDAGTATVTITGAGRYAGSVSRTFKIARAEISVPKAVTGLVYNGKEQAGVPSGAGYYVTGGTATNAGSYTATATADKNHAFPGGASTAAVKWSIAKATVAVPEAKSGLVYNGGAQTGVAAGPGYSVKGGSAADAGGYTATATADRNHAFPGGASTASVKWSIAKATVAVPEAKSGLVFNRKTQTGVAAGAGCTVKGGSATNAGSYTATATADKNHAFAGGKTTATVKWSIGKAANVLKVKPVKATQTTEAGKKMTVKPAKAFRVAKNASKGRVTYKLTYVSRAAKRYVKVAKNGKVTVYKGLKVGTYAIRVKATSAATKNYNAASKTVRLKIQVKSAS